MKKKQIFLSILAGVMVMALVSGCSSGEKPAANVPASHGRRPKGMRRCRRKTPCP